MCVTWQYTVSVSKGVSCLPKGLRTSLLFITIPLSPEPNIVISCPLSIPEAHPPAGLAQSPSLGLGWGPLGPSIKYCCCPGIAPDPEDPNKMCLVIGLDGGDPADRTSGPFSSKVPQRVTTHSATWSVASLLKIEKMSYAG